jgi:hypothetical protein
VNRRQNAQMAQGHHDRCNQDAPSDLHGGRGSSVAGIISILVRRKVPCQGENGGPGSESYPAVGESSAAATAMSRLNPGMRCAGD